MISLDRLQALLVKLGERQAIGLGKVSGESYHVSGVLRAADILVVSFASVAAQNPEGSSDTFTNIFQQQKQLRRNESLTAAMRTATTHAALELG
jgi:hypothetical protein